MKSCIIVIKLGTSSIVDEVTHQPMLAILSSLVEAVVKLKTLGHKVVLVSSGAIGVGLKRMEVSGKPKTLSGKQASQSTLSLERHSIFEPQNRHWQLLDKAAS